MNNNPENTSSTGTNSFDKSLNKNLNDFGLPPNQWTFARNSINNSVSGDLGKLGNEPSNLFCSKAPYKIIGTIHVVGDTWLIYSTDNTNSEIGIFEERICSYTTIVNDTCLGFNQDHLIKGVSRALSTCNFTAYWADGLNPDRALKFTIDTPADNAYTNPNSPIPWIRNCNIIDGCNICTNTSRLDCDAIRLARFIQAPCIEVLKGVGAGTLLNGSYMVAISYAIDGQKISDWYISNVQPVFTHDNAGNSIDVELKSLDQDFDQVIIGLISITNQQTVVRKAGIYSTRQKKLSFDTIDNSWPVIAIEEIPIMTPVANKTDAMYTVNDYLLRVGTTSKEDFNYQPLANQIVTKWQSVEYPGNYYRKGGNKTNYLRDEVYSFFIRWVYDTGDKSSDYHIPGRPSGNFTGLSDFAVIANADSAPEFSAGLTPYNWIVYNTATNITIAPSTLPDGGVLIGEGLMGYWESTELYPDNKPQVWNSVTNPLGNGFNTTISPYAGFGSTSLNELDLCGKHIRHHRFPDMGLSGETQYLNPTNGNIRIMGVKFENIKAPLMNDGITPIPGIVGYEILRGTRNGNKTILAKGLINNMRLYTLPNGESNTRQGAFPNYPYNEVGRPDPFLSTSSVSFNACNVWGGGGGGEVNYNAQTDYSKFLFTFHSPDTNFTHPFLSAKELKVHGEFNGDVIGKFEKSEEHPKEKLITNTAFIISAIAGVAVAGLALNGQRSVRHVQPQMPGMSEANLPGPGTMTTWSAPYGNGTSTLTTTIPATNTVTSPTFTDQIQIPAQTPLLGAAYTAYEILLGSGAAISLNLSGQTADSIMAAMQIVQDITNSTTSAFSTRAQNIDQEDGALKNIPGPLRLFAGLPIFFNYFTQGTDTFLELFKTMSRYRDFALRYHSHGYYNRYKTPVIGNTRRVISNAEYMGPQITDLGLSTRVNNLYRINTVAIDLARPTSPEPWHQEIQNTIVNDVTRVRASSVVPLLSTDIFGNANRLVDPTKANFGPYTTFTNIIPGNSGIQICSSHYVSLKQRIRNQYGQISGVLVVPVSECVMSKGDITTSSNTLFGGDTYLGRYTEKNTFFFFYNWLYGQPDGAQIDYTKNEMIPYPRYWANFDEFETNDFTSSLTQLLSFNPNPSGLILPSSYYNLDGIVCPPGALASIAQIRISVRDAWFYLFSSGVRDFYVESEINIDLRDWGELETEQHYDPYRYTNTKSIFDTKIIKFGNYYKYDQSLSISKLFLNYISWAASQRITYDPYIAETCFVYNAYKLIYSLPANFESLRDNWYIFLANNYVITDDIVKCIKALNKSGALIFYEASSPTFFPGMDQLQTLNGTKLTIGDGGLFSQPMQSTSNTDTSYEYGSCQDRLSVINTPAGIFWISQNQGKIFQYDGQNAPIELSMLDLKWWFVTYLPYQLVKQFPDFELIDNPVIGIGCQSMYDNENSLVYFTKKDYIVRKDLPSSVTVGYIGSNDFTVSINDVRMFQVKLGDPNYFEDASWTISYDPKSKGWLSYHDWHPNLNIPGKNTFLTIQDNSVWIHNTRCDSYCNYYGMDYPWEIEYMVNTIQTVNSLKSIEYILEVYKYDVNCYDRFHVLDFNFDEAVVYNTEQVSGLLKLNLEPKNDPQLELSYPIVNFADIDILYSKVEQKYRFDMFWDITDDRGEFNPAAQRMIWNTGANGYVKTLNPNNLNYNKDSFEQKAFRHYTTTVLLRRKISGDRKMMTLLTNNKNLISPR